MATTADTLITLNVAWIRIVGYSEFQEAELDDFFGKTAGIANADKDIPRCRANGQAKRRCYRKTNSGQEETAAWYGRITIKIKRVQQQIVDGDSADQNGCTPHNTPDFVAPNIGGRASKRATVDQAMPHIAVVVMTGIVVRALRRMGVGFGGIDAAGKTKRRKEEGEDNQPGQQNSADRKSGHPNAPASGQLMPFRRSISTIDKKAPNRNQANSERRSGF